MARWRSKIKGVDTQSLTAGKVDNVPCFYSKKFFVHIGFSYCNNIVGMKTTNKNYFSRILNLKFNHCVTDNDGTGTSYRCIPSQEVTALQHRVLLAIKQQRIPTAKRFRRD